MLRLMRLQKAAATSKANSKADVMVDDSEPNIEDLYIETWANRPSAAVANRKTGEMNLVYATDLVKQIAAFLPGA
jgi:hypothetical protein